VVRASDAAATLLPATKSLRVKGRSTITDLLFQDDVFLHGFYAMSDRPQLPSQDEQTVDVGERKSQFE
jgi:hypothetical protein